MRTSIKYSPEPSKLLQNPSSAYSPQNHPINKLNQTDQINYITDKQKHSNKFFKKEQIEPDPEKLEQSQGGQGYLETKGKWNYQ